MAKTSTALTRANFYVGGPQLRLFEEISTRTQISVSEHVRRAMDLYINHWARQQQAGLTSTIAPLVDKLPEKP